MAQGPDIARIAAMVGDPARSNMLSALMSGQALTARELADVAGVTAATASGHLTQLTDAGLLWMRKQGRHRYFALADADVANALETLAGLAATRGHVRSQPGPNDQALRHARVCYDHLAGTLGVAVFDSLADAGALAVTCDDITLTDLGAKTVGDLGLDPSTLKTPRRPLCRVCLDWSERRSHLAGALGAALLTHFEAQDWVRRRIGSRHLDVTAKGTQGFRSHFGIRLD
ncbi:MAG: helix-turn-helix transcriptional regulator [Pseudomonadota bacterium]